MYHFSPVYNLTPHFLDGYSYGVGKSDTRELATEHAFSDLFITHMLTRNIRIQADLIDQLFNSSEKRLARALLLLARYGKEDQPHGILPKVSQ